MLRDGINNAQKYPRADELFLLPHSVIREHTMPAKGSSFWVFAFGYLILAAGVMNVGFDLYGRVEWSVPTNMGIVVGEAALILLGLFAQTIGQSIRQLERRLDAIEAKRR